MDRGGYTCGADVDLSDDVHPNYVRMGSRVKIRTGTKLWGSPEFVLEMGDDIYIGHQNLLLCGAEKLTIGNRVTIAHGVKIHTDTFPNTSPLLQKHYPVTKGPVTVEDDVWVCDNVVVLPNVRIGHGSVVAACSLVREDVQPHTVVGGVPHKVLKELADDRASCATCKAAR